MLERFEKFITNNQLNTKGQRILLAVSGGIDSMVMLDLFRKSSFNFGIAHCNFQLRGKESDEDELFVDNYAKKSDIPCFTKRFKTQQYADEKGISIQMAARGLRYEWFKNLCIEQNYDLVAIAHNADDVIETFLTNLTRGTGIKGLTGIKAKSGNVIRPLLFASRAEIEAYGKQNNIAYREDTSNKSTKYDRNYIRHEVIPRFEKMNPDFRSTILETIERIKETEMIYRDQIEDKTKNIIHDKGDKVYISIEKLKAIHPLKTYLFEILRPYQFSEDNLDKIIESLDALPGKKFHAEKHYLLRDRDYLIIGSINTGKRFDETYFIDKETRSIDSPIKLCFSKHNYDKDFSIERNENSAQLDYQKLKFPLELRKWREGDYFYPLGMQQKKKLSDFFVDQKIPLDEKKDIWVLNSKEEIVWIAGYRIDDRFKINPQTQYIYTIQMER